MGNTDQWHGHEIVSRRRRGRRQIGWQILNGGIRRASQGYRDILSFPVEMHLCCHARFLKQKGILLNRRRDIWSPSASPRRAWRKGRAWRCKFLGKNLKRPFVGMPHRQPQDYFPHRPDGGVGSIGLLGTKGFNPCRCVIGEPLRFDLESLHQGKDAYQQISDRIMAAIAALECPDDRVPMKREE